MLPTRLTVWLFALGLLPLLAGMGYAVIDGADPAVAAALRLFVLTFDVAPFLLFLVDAALAARSRRLRVRRERPPSLSVGVRNEVVVHLDNTGRRHLHVRVRDEPPTAFPVEPALLEAIVPARGWV